MNSYGFKLPYFFGCICFVIVGGISIYMWKLEQFGLQYIPSLNIRGSYKTHITKTHLFFIFFYNITAAVSLYGIAYSIQCNQYIDWSKNFAMLLLLSLGIISLNSILHRDPDIEPWSYLNYFLRVILIGFTINAIIDVIHLSSYYCHSQCPYD